MRLTKMQVVERDCANALFVMDWNQLPLFRSLLSTHNLLVFIFHGQIIDVVLCSINTLSRKTHGQKENQLIKFKRRCSHSSKLRILCLYWTTSSINTKKCV